MAPERACRSAFSVSLTPRSCLHAHSSLKKAPAIRRSPDPRLTRDPTESHAHRRSATPAVCSPDDGRHVSALPARFWGGLECPRLASACLRRWTVFGHKHVGAARRTADQKRLSSVYREGVVWRAGMSMKRAAIRAGHGNRALMIRASWGAPHAWERPAPHGTTHMSRPR